ncbi:OVARIAN TUMOR DOMAIN-containing deubiquitinating enzyme 1-like [Lolium rigidum]|uniref:OVARIAN TUMOR DOMAIN-containing deubiquitinating enzyme 1-like n=1 Tax=Lolium rigidum TaxID=89674 RepID=UPI001F5DAA3F|nr:OVARIAN TUMOR DOMAIN-containing deubiquitinating enzyme 1-like [Lolium rigidum]
MGSKANSDDLARASSSGDSGGGGDTTPPSPPRLPVAPPLTSPSRVPGAPSTSAPPLQPPLAPPRAADRDTDEGLDADYLSEEENDGSWNWEQEEAEYNNRHLRELEDDADSLHLEEGEVADDQNRGENLRGPSDSKLMRPPKEYPTALRFLEPISDLILKSSNNYIIQEKIKILSKQYGLLRRTRSDGSCFYRAFLFSYLENLGQMQDRQAEVIRLMKCVEVSTERLYQLHWGEAYLLKRDYLLSLVFEFYCLVNSVANGLTSEKLYERSLEDPSSGTIMYFLRVLTEVEIRTQDIYRPFIPKDMDVVQYCRKKVRGVFPEVEAKVEALQFCRTKVCHQYAEAEAIQMRALTYALGIPLRVEIVDTKSMPGQAVRVKRLDFFNRSGLGKRPYHIVQSYYSSSTAHKPLERGSNDNLLSSDGAPLLTLLSRHGHCDILYPK